MVRQTYLDRSTETPGTWTIERIGDPIERGELDPAFLAKALGTAAFSLHGTAALFASWTEMFMTRPNELVDFGQEMFQKAGGDPEIFYLHGYWTLEPGAGMGDRDRRARLPVLELPARQLVDGVARPRAPDHRQQAHRDARRRRRLTIVVADRDPGWGNWIDTCGHGSGTALLRWLGAEKHPIPDCRVIDLEAS